MMRLGPCEAATASERHAQIHCHIATWSMDDRLYLITWRFVSADGLSDLDVAVGTWAAFGGKYLRRVRNQLEISE